MELKFRTLRADEIEARVSTVSEKGCSLLIYKDSRVDQNLLDETVGPLNWQRDHKMIGDRLYSTVSIYDDAKGEWISKTDVGTESYTEKEKGQASDSFKRACFNWGIGRELYTAPFIWIKAGDVKIEPKGNGFTTRDSFRVSSIGYDENRRINSLQIIKVDKWGDNHKVVFEFGNALFAQDKKPAKKTTKKKAEPKAEPKPKPIPEDTSAPVLATYDQRKTLYDLCQTVYVDYNKLLAKVGCTDPKQLTAEQHAAALNRLKNTDGN